MGDDKISNQGSSTFFPDKLPSKTASQEERIKTSQGISPTKQTLETSGKIKKLGRPISDVDNSAKTASEMRAKMLKPEEMDSPLKKKLDTLLADNAAFVDIAFKNGMSREEIEKHLLYIDKNLSNWVSDGKHLYINRKDSGLARTIEYLPDSGTVVTHFKSKTKPGGEKGQPLGKGHISVVKQSIVVLSKNLLGRQFETGMDIADKTPLDKTDVAARSKSLESMSKEGQITQKFADSQNVRKVYRINEKGLLLEGMNAGSLNGHIGGTAFTSEQKGKIAQGLINGMAEIHRAGYVHCDLHAGNCFLNKDATAKVGDLECATTEGNEDQGQGNFFAYSPQRLRAQVSGEPYQLNQKDDVWSMGLVLYQLEHGALPPFAEPKNMDELIDAIRERDACKAKGGDFRQAQKKVNELFDKYLDAAINFVKGQWKPTSNLDQLIHQMLQLSPQHRLNSTAAVSQADAHLKGTSVSFSEPPELSVPKIKSPTTETLVHGYAIFTPPPSLPTYDSSKMEDNIFQAISFSDRSYIESHLEDFIGWRGPNNETVLHLAIANRSDLEKMNLVNAAANSGMLNFKNFSGQTALDLAVNTPEDKRVDTVKNLLQVGASTDNPNSIKAIVKLCCDKTEVSRNEIFAAIMNNKHLIEKFQKEILSTLLEHGAIDFAEKIFKSRPPSQELFHELTSNAIQTSNLRAVYFLESQRSVLMFPPPGNREHLLTTIVSNNDVEILNVLFAKPGHWNKEDLKFQNPDTGKTLLHVALESSPKTPETLNLLLEAGLADTVNVKDKAGQTPLHIAILNNQFALARLLIAYGADLNVKDNEGKTPLDLVKQSAPVTNLDVNRLLQGVPGDSLIKDTHREWFLNQAVLFEHMYMKGVDENTRKQLALLMLHGYSKAATIAEDRADILGIQTSPLLPSDTRYHRSTENELLTRLNKDYAAAMEFKPEEIQLVHSSLFKEVIERENPNSVKEVKSKAQFEAHIDQILEGLKQGKPLTQDWILFDVSSKPTDLTEDDLHPIIKDKVTAFKAINPNVELNWWELTDKLGFFALTKFKDQDILVMPEIHGLRNYAIQKYFTSILGHTGFVLSPDQAKEAWLKLNKPEEILEELGISEAMLATRGLTYPTVCKSFKDFVSQEVVKKFKNLSNDPKAPPYQQVLPKAVSLLLEGLANKEIDKKFADKGIGSLLQTSYFRMINAMNEAILRKNNLIAFNNQIELIHQEIQTILEICQPYDQNALANGVVEKLTSSPNPIVPGNLGPPLVHLKPSAMHCYSSAIAGVEAQKKAETGSSNLNMVFLKDTYYESAEVLHGAKSHSFWTLDGDKFSKDDIKGSFADGIPDKPIDLFVCEFHHNVSLERKVYRPEQIASQIIAMHKENILADKCTVVIDTTIDLEKSDDVRNFLANPEINKLISDGKLNVVLLRSAQKFDMLGADNYYGGITTTINNKEAFALYNKRADHPDDQLGGLSYQGLAHLQSCSGDSIDKYREAIMANTQSLYEKLPRKAIYEEGTKNPLQISKIEDKRLVFLDIKMPNYPKLYEAMKTRLGTLAYEENLPFTNRSSFGFPTTNLTIIQQTKMRLNPGLDGEKTLNRYAAFFTAVQEAIEKVINESPGKDLKDLDSEFEVAINNLKVP